MDINFVHKPVLFDETIEGLDIKENGIYVDCTLGGAGHSSEILRRLKGGGLLVGIDQDADALGVATERLAKIKSEGEYKIEYSNFEFIDKVCDKLHIEKVNGILMDIGVSSWQLDEGERGFSYHQDAPLDMRMDRNNPLSAREVVNEYDEEKLVEIFYKYGEEKWSARIARFIVEERKKNEISTTAQLVDVIKKAVPAAARKDKHPGKRVFQAIRIEVNDELGVLERAIEKAVNLLEVGGRLAIITFHSLEDRIVKDKFKELARGCTCPKDIPVCICNKVPLVKLVNRKPIIAGEKELQENSRARSAKLRIVERI